MNPSILQIQIHFRPYMVREIEDVSAEIVFRFLTLHSIHLYLQSNPIVAKQSVKQFAHSPHLPFRVSSNFAGLLYLGNRVIFRHCGQA